MSVLIDEAETNICLKDRKSVCIQVNFHHGENGSQKTKKKLNPD